MKFLCFPDFGDDVTAVTFSLFLLAFTPISQVKTHCLHTSVSFLFFNIFFINPVHRLYTTFELGRGDFSI